MVSKCLENTKFERGFVGDTIGWFPKSLLNGIDVIWKVDDKIRDRKWRNRPNSRTKSECKFR